MQKVTVYLLMTLFTTSTLAVTEGSTDSKPTQPNVCNQLLEKIDNINCKTDSSLTTQVMALTSKVAIVETQLKVELQTTKDQLQNTKAEQEKTKAEQRKTKAALQKIMANLKSTTDELQHTKSEVELLRSRESNPGSSSFVRWGRKTCPGNTSLVYSGVAGGKHWAEKGSGTNRLCLSRQPEFDNSIKPSHWGQLYGAEYQFIQGHHDHDVPCSVCRTPLSTTIMVPGTRACPQTWTRQYHGHLISERHVHFASEYVCLDKEPEDDSSGAVNQNDSLFYYTVTRCGTLPCPPYVNGKVVTCVVCSK